MEPSYSIELKPRAERALVRLPAMDRAAILAAIHRLGALPRPAGALKLQARGPLWRIRVRDYRVIYAVFDPDRLVTISAIERRNERTYRDLDDLIE